MIKVVCIDNLAHEGCFDEFGKEYRHKFITIGKIYEYDGYCSHNNYISICNDSGVETAYEKYNFKILAEYREQQINEILND